MCLVLAWSGPTTKKKMDTHCLFSTSAVRCLCNTAALQSSALEKTAAPQQPTHLCDCIQCPIGLVAQLHVAANYVPVEPCTVLQTGACSERHGAVSPRPFARHCLHLHAVTYGWVSLPHSCCVAPVGMGFPRIDSRRQLRQNAVAKFQAVVAGDCVCRSSSVPSSSRGL